MKSEIDYVVESIADRRAGEYFAEQYAKGGRTRLLQKFLTDAMMSGLEKWVLEMRAKGWPEGFNTILMEPKMYARFARGGYVGGGRVGWRSRQLRMYEMMYGNTLYGTNLRPLKWHEKLLAPIRRWWKKLTTPARTIYVDIETDGFSKVSRTGRNTAARVEDMLRPYQRETYRRVMESPPTILSMNYADIERRVMAHADRETVELLAPASWGKTEDAMRQLNQALSKGTLAADELRRQLRNVRWDRHHSTSRFIPWSWVTIWDWKTKHEKNGSKYVFRNIWIGCVEFTWTTYFEGDA